MRVIFTLVFLFTHLFLQAQVFRTDSGQVIFTSKTSLTSFEGKSNSVVGTLDLTKNQLSFSLNLESLNTGIGLRDKHMRDNYLETKTYPKAYFDGKLKEIPQLKVGETSKVEALGKFTLHGVTKEIRVPGTLSLVSPDKLMLCSDWSIRLEDFQIEAPKLIFYEVAQEQKISLAIDLERVQ